MSKKLLQRQNDNRMKSALENFEKPLSDIDINEIETTIGKINVIPSGVVEAAPVETEEAINETELVTSYQDISIDMLYAAPEEWNLWTPYSDEKKYELMESIQEIGLQQNLVLWKVPNRLKYLIGETDGYLILVGHNRATALRSLYHITDDPQYLVVHAKVYEGDSIDERIARRIIDDTNLVTRDKSLREISLAYLRRCEELRKSDELKDASERMIHSIIANENNTSRTQVFKSLKMLNCIEPIFDQVMKEISFNTGLALSSLDSDVQQYIYDEYYLKRENRHLYTNKNLSKIKPLMTIQKIDSVMHGRNGVVKVTFDVESHLVDDLNKLVNKFLNANR